ncbi:hypothetical protein K438DRAFT_1981589 [Mycena galopus ATCC 62051]|nr:hypothetical protein K438DRAFT_1981589 [Mycena galopus ATCC 62051]
MAPDISPPRAASTPSPRAEVPSNCRDIALGCKLELSTFSLLVIAAHIRCFVFARVLEAGARTSLYTSPGSHNHGSYPCAPPHPLIIIGCPLSLAVFAGPPFLRIAVPAPSRCIPPQPPNPCHSWIPP